MSPAFAILALLSVFGAAQDPAQRGQTELAQVANLHRSVYESPTPSLPVYTAARELGLRYIEGRGVERDQTQGCALLLLAFWDRSMHDTNDRAATAEAEGLHKLHCSALSPDQSEEEWILASCGIFGVRPQVIALAPGSQIDISRRGLVLGTPAGQTSRPLISVSGGMVGCGHQVPLLRYTRVDPPIGLGLPARHLLELAEWSSAPGATTGTMERMLGWHLFDITSKIDEVAFEFLEEGSGSGSAWPMPALPAGLERGATFAMQPSGVIHWEIPGEPKHTGEFK